MTFFKKIFSKHEHNYSIKLYNIPMENETSFFVTQCKCGKTNLVRAHNKSNYFNWFVCINRNENNYES